MREQAGERERERGRPPRPLRDSCTATAFPRYTALPGKFPGRSDTLIDGRITGKLRGSPLASLYIRFPPVNLELGKNSRGAWGPEGAEGCVDSFAAARDDIPRVALDFVAANAAGNGRLGF